MVPAGPVVQAVVQAVEPAAHPGGDRLGVVLGKLRARGGRVTEPRLAIVSVLLSGEHHLTVQDFERQIRTTQPGINASTFYRTLTALEKLGVIYHLHLGHGPAVWHLVDAHHEHLVCRHCGDVFEVDADTFDVFRASIVERYGFLVETRHFVNQGTCAVCGLRRGPAQLSEVL